MDQAPQVVGRGGKLEGRQIAFTGRLASMTREEAAELVRAHGGEFAPSPGQRTTHLVVGQEGWPLRDDGRPSRKLEKARALREAGISIAVIPEEEFLEEVGLEERRQDIHRRFTITQLARILGVSPARVRVWVRRGLLRPTRTVHRLAYFDFRQAAGAREIWRLLQAGVPLERLRRSLRLLQGALGGIEEPLLQLSLLEDGRGLLARLEDGRLVDPRGQLHFPFGDPGASEKQPLRMERRPRSADDWFALALDREDAGLFEEAAEAYREALLAGGPEPEICFNLGNTLYGLGRVEQAAERFRQAVELDGAYVEAWNNLGNVLWDLDETDCAIRAYQRALEIEPGYADVHYNLAEILHEKGFAGEARLHWRAYLDQDPRSQWADHVRSRLRGEG